MTQQPTPPPRPSLRLATFNIENLFSRPEFADTDETAATIGTYRFVDAAEARLAKRIVEAATSDDKRQLSAQALFAAGADIACLQEVDNLDALDIFYERYLTRLAEPEVAAARRAYIREQVAQGLPVDRARLAQFDAKLLYPWRVVVEGNDGRGIDVALLSKLAPSVRTHAHRSFEELGAWSSELERYTEKINGLERRFTPTDRVFRRDCLEVDVTVGGKPLTLYLCHLKSMSGSRERTRIMRVAEMKAVKRLVSDRFGRGTPDANWAIVGDLNDYYEVDGNRDIRNWRTGDPSPSALDVLVADWLAVNIMERRPPDDRWTSYHAAEDSYAQLDYILLSPALAAANPTVVPEILRSGLPYRARRYGGPRLPRVGWDRPKASDHCPVTVDLIVP